MAQDEGVDLPQPRCAVCGQPLQPDEPHRQVGENVSVHSSCAHSAQHSTDEVPQRSQPPRRLSERLAHTSFPRRRR